MLKMEPSTLKSEDLDKLLGRFFQIYFRPEITFSNNLAHFETEGKVYQSEQHKWYCEWSHDK
jgi:hypothetical protein